MAAPRWLIIGVLVTGLLAWPRGAAASFHIEAGDISLTLNEWSRQSHLQILFDYRLIHKRQTLPVICECTNAEALELLLLGTGLIFDFVNERTVAVTPPHPVSSDELAHALRGFEQAAQSYAEGAGPPGPEMTVILPPQVLGSSP